MTTRIGCLVAFLAGAALMTAIAPPGLALQKGKSKKGDPPKANDGIIVNWGKPPKFEPGAPAHFWIWYDDGVWHLRTTTQKKQHRFDGLIEVAGGRVTDLNVPKGEGFGPNSDRIAWNKERTAILFDFVTDGAVDGVNFKVDKTATALKLKLVMDGTPNPKVIAVGRAGDHPKAAEFVLPAHPPAPKKKK
jgi:hypothetical protein